MLPASPLLLFYSAPEVPVIENLTCANGLPHPLPLSLCGVLRQ
jgi:hypothetical protein